MDEPQPGWWVIIETNSYAGNFERTMGAWCTGAYGETHGKFESADCLSELENTGWAHIPDNVGYCCGGERAMRWALPKNQKSTDGLDSIYTGVAIPFNKRPSRSDVRFMLWRAADYAEKVRSGYFSGKRTISCYAQETLQVTGIQVRHLRLSETITDRIKVHGAAAKSSKKNPRS
jgi:hypothetical protein